MTRSVFRYFDIKLIPILLQDKVLWIRGFAAIGLMMVVGVFIQILTLLPEGFHVWIPFAQLTALLIGGFWVAWAWQRICQPSYWGFNTSDEWVYERLRRGRLGDWVFDMLVEMGLSVDAALAKMTTAADRIEQETGKRPSMATAKRIQRLRRAEKKADD